VAANRWRSLVSRLGREGDWRGEVFERERRERPSRPCRLGPSSPPAPAPAAAVDKERRPSGSRRAAATREFEGGPSPPPSQAIPRSRRDLATPMGRGAVGAPPRNGQPGVRGRAWPSPDQGLPLSRRLTGGVLHREAAAQRQWGVRGRAWPSPEPCVPPLPPPLDKGRYPLESRRTAATRGFGGGLAPPPIHLLPLSRRRGRGGWGVRAVPTDPAARPSRRYRSDTYSCQAAAGKGAGG